MTTWTWAQLKAKVISDLNLTGEDFVDPTELLGYGNEAVSQTEKQVHTIYEDYLLASSPVALTAGTSDYALPSDIFAHKIRGLYYNDGTTKYEISRIKKLSDVNYVESTWSRYEYRIVNSASVGPRIRLFPASLETSSSNVVCWYIRSAARFATDADTLDIPEAANFVIAYVKECVKAKERNLASIEWTPALKLELQALIETLTQMVPDDDTSVPLELDFYAEHE